MKSKKDYISMLNDLGNSLSREEWIIGGKDRYTGRDNYGVMLKRYDPIAFEVGYNEWKKQPYIITTRKMNKIIEDYKKIVAGNEAGKNICFMSRGEYADPKIAYNGILMNYWDVYDCMDEVEEPTDDDWLNAVSNLFDSYTYDIKNTDVDKFKMSDVMNVYRIINL